MNTSGSPAEDPASCWGGLQWEGNESFGAVVRTPTFSNSNDNHSREGLANHHPQDWGWHIDTALQSERQHPRHQHLWHHHHHHQQHPPPSSPPAPAMEEFLGQASARREHQPISFISPGSLFNSTSIVPAVVPPPLFPPESNTMSNIFPSLRNRFVDTSMGGASPSPVPPAFHGALASYPPYPGFAANRSQQLQSSPFDQHRRHLFGILGIADHKAHLGYIGKREAETLSASEHGAAARIGLDLGARTYFSAEDTIFGQMAVKRQRANGPGAHVPLCQADGCKADLSHAKHYHRRHKVCELHSKAPTVIAGGQTQRFCQQCSRFHSLLEFDDGKRSCRKRLADHNRRRRKPQPATPMVGASVPSETTMPLVKKENDDSHESASSAPAGGQQAAPTDPHGLLSSISLATGKVQVPVTLMNAAGAPLSTLSERSKEAVWASQFTQDVGQSSTHLSLSSSGTGFELEGRPASGALNIDLTDSVARPLDLQHMISRKNIHSSQLGETELSSGVQPFPSLVQNLLPVQSSRDLTTTDWMMIREQSSQFGMDMNGNLEKQQVLSLLETPSSLDSEGTGQRAAVEFLQRHASLNSRDDPDSHRDGADQNDMKFSELHGLRAFGSSLYESDRNVL